MPTVSWRQFIFIYHHDCFVQGVTAYEKIFKAWKKGGGLKIASPILYWHDVLQSYFQFFRYNDVLYLHISSQVSSQWSGEYHSVPHHWPTLHLHRTFSVRGNVALPSLRGVTIYTHDSIPSTPTTTVPRTWFLCRCWCNGVNGCAGPAIGSILKGVHNNDNRYPECIEYSR